MDDYADLKGPALLHTAKSCFQNYSHESVVPSRKTANERTLSHRHAGLGEVSCNACTVTCELFEKSFVWMQLSPVTYGIST